VLTRRTIHVTFIRNAGEECGADAPDVKNYGPNHTFDYGSCVAALWLDR
jgi:hypothetical protein